MAFQRHNSKIIQNQPSARLLAFRASFKGVAPTEMKIQCTFHINDRNDTRIKYSGLLDTHCMQWSTLNHNIRCTTSTLETVKWTGFMI